MAVVQQAALVKLQTRNDILVHQVKDMAGRVDEMNVHFKELIAQMNAKLLKALRQMTFFLLFNHLYNQSPPLYPLPFNTSVSKSNSTPLFVVSRLPL